MRHRWALGGVVVGVGVVCGEGDTCLASGVTPAETSTKYALAFCTKFQSSRCCLPVHDNMIQREFSNLLASSTVCAEMLNVHKSSLSQIMCASCSPQSPAFLSRPVDTAFFGGTATFKVCATFAAAVAPTEFDQCGLSQQAYRFSPCTPTNPVSATAAWPDSCRDGMYICQSKATQAFSCQTTPCAASDVPTGFANAPCSNFTCTPSSMFLNDNGGAKPVFYEDFAVEIVPDSEHCLGPVAADGSSAAVRRAGWNSIVVVVALGSAMRG
ncbi:hypothetical protein H310_14307 [Aphanomyces invadans]|uniref:Folate receptor-like domain-containing protein n=1 Tax=Aphanomyces invadans TaxID=157072 RepID=A0A024TAA8_9STRA|nr:hypothetical protein H310_14307 [Aphanomyces invadans]ETV90963.1 hypothetical protein H310_14307 [Aphanomyces invadans]|eukprot:XP_008880352.1 hypothetical protein H310_14307 [Aphanomyces invadans]